MIAVAIDRITISYSATPVVSDLSWEVHDDRIVGFVGPNGSGKSSILKAIVGEVSPGGGTISHRTGLTIGYLPQDLSFPPRTRVFDAVRQGAGALIETEEALAQVERRLTDPSVYEDEAALAAVLHAQEELLNRYDRLGGPGLEARIRSILHALGFRDPDFDRPVDELSGGQRKLVGLAARVIGRPDVLLLDEPLGALDPLTRATLQDWLLSVWAELRKTILLVTHDVEEALLLSDRVIVLTDRPASITRDLHVGLPRPRSRASAELAETKGRLLDLLLEGR